MFNIELKAYKSSIDDLCSILPCFSNIPMILNLTTILVHNLYYISKFFSEKIRFILFSNKSIIFNKVY